jgi:hypothetical protein
MGLHHVAEPDGRLVVRGGMDFDIVLHECMNGARWTAEEQIRSRTRERLQQEAYRRLGVGYRAE